MREKSQFINPFLHLEYRHPWTVVSFELFLLCCRVSPLTLKRRHEDSEDCNYIKASKKPVTITEEHVRNAIYFFVMDFLFRNPNPATSFFLSPLKVMLL